MYTIVITSIEKEDVMELITHTAKTILNTSDGCPFRTGCGGQDCPDCIESHIHILHNAD